jgi:hypothetical protein
VDDWITTGVDPVTGLATLTIEAWVLFPAPPTTAVVAGASNGVAGAMLYITGGNLRPFAGNTVNAGSTPAPVGRWFHYAMTYDGTNLRGYLDGVLFGTWAIGLSAFSANFAIGGYGANPAGAPVGALGGFVRDVRVWSRALTAAELAPYRPTLRGDEAGLVGWWPLEGDTLDRTVRPLWQGGSDDFGVTGALTTLNGRAYTGRNLAGLVTPTAAGGESVVGGVWGWYQIDVGATDIDVTWVLGPSGASTWLVVKSDPVLTATGATLQWNMSDSQVYYAGGLLVSNGGANGVVGATGQVRRMRYENGRLQGWRDGTLVVDVVLSTTQKAAVDAASHSGGSGGVDRWTVTPLSAIRRHGTARNGARPAIARAVA